MKSLLVKTALGALLLSGVVSTSSPASAMPALNGAAASKASGSAIEQVHGWRRYGYGGYGGYGYYGRPRYYGGGWGHPGWGYGGGHPGWGYGGGWRRAGWGYGGGWGHPGYGYGGGWGGGYGGWGW